MVTKVLLADDHKIIREGLRHLLNHEPGIEVVGEAGNGHDAVRLTDEVKPDVVIMDIGMPQLNGIEATRQIKSKHNDIKVVALSVHADHRYITKTLAAGATGYLLKDSAVEDVVAAIHAVMSDKSYLSAQIVDAVVTDYVGQVSNAHTAPAPKLTAREREVLQLLAEGHSTREIADVINVSSKTVDTHRRNIMIKLDIQSIAELTKYALREGLVSLNQ